jgi:hypothetical protein
MADIFFKNMKVHKKVPSKEPSGDSLSDKSKIIEKMSPEEEMELEQIEDIDS